MKAILMAAGMGTRIASKTNKPKSLLDIGDGPLIEHTVKMLLKHDIQVCLCLGFKGEMIKEALKDYPITYYENPFYKVTNSIASLWFAKDQLDTQEDIILGNADVFWQEDILNVLNDADEDVILLGDTSRCLTGDYFFHCEDNMLKEYGKEMPFDHRTSEYVGLAKVKASFISTFKERMMELIHLGDYQLWWENTLYSMIDERNIMVRDIATLYWSEIDVLSDYESILLYRKQKQHTQGA